MTIYKTIFFDWGGVVANDPGDDFLNALLRQLGASDSQIDEIFQNYMPQFMRGEITEIQYWAILKDTYGFKIHDSISEEFKKWKGLVANEDILHFVARLKAKGYRTAILSNVIEPTYNVLKQAGYYDMFDEIIASCKVGYAKPQKEIYELALKQLKTTGAESIFIDDKQRNLVPAKEMGFEVVLAVDPDQIISDIDALLIK
ncbi:MAG: HAD family phosphatase [Candidatus Saccharimonadales bacterium]